MSSKNEPTVLTYDSIEDTQSISTVDKMYEKFIRRIDLFRSIASSPNLGINTYRSGSGGVDGDNTIERVNFSLSIDPEGFSESRAHAFYRMVGLPVASSEGSDVFYNPGHDPQQINTVMNRRKVNTSLNELNPAAVKLSQNRETQLKNRTNIFVKQDELASIYSIMLSYPKPFLMAKTGQGPFDNDIQSQPIAGRKEQLQAFKPNNIIIPKFVTDPEHILKPFIVNPDIESAVTEEYKRRVCVPFLPDKASTRTTQDDYLKRPILEYIIRQRLRISAPNTNFIAASKRFIAAGISSSGENNVRDVILALSGGDVSNIDQGLIVGLTSIQSSSILMFTKAIRVAVSELDASIRKFKNVRSAITIQPIPTTSGPEFGGKVRTISTIEQPSDIDRKIAIMELMQVISEDQSTIDQDDIDVIGNADVFASAEVSDVSKNFQPDIKKLSRQRDAYGKDLIASLRSIEIITGEISGLGLVDVLAAYTALWAIDMRHLIGFLDTRSLERIQNSFPKLINDEIQTQLNGDRPSITETLEVFERIFFNVLAYADAAFVQAGSSPIQARKGSIT